MAKSKRNEHQRALLTMLVVFGALAIAFAAAGTSAADRPNIIHIFVDDLGWTDHSAAPAALGNQSQFYQTPTIERLAAEGLSFTSGHAVQTCSPTRAALMTGQYATRTGVYNVTQLSDSVDLIAAPNTSTVSASATTTAETLQSAGYTTAHFGKFGVTSNSSAITSSHGFDYNYGGSTTNAPGSYYASNSSGNWQFHNAVGPELDPYAAPYDQTYVDDNIKPFASGVSEADMNALVGKPKHLTDATADAAIDFMKNETEANTPFYMNVAFHGVHTPIEPRSDLEEKYQDIIDANGGISPDSRHDNTAYAALIEGVDQGIARILDYIENPDGDVNTNDSIADNTLVLFYSDNGGGGQATSNAPLQGNKGSQYEGGLRVPLIAWMPGKVAPGTSVQPVHTVDFYPTFAELAGATLPDRATHPLDGESLTRVLKGETNTLNREAIYFHLPGSTAGSSPTSTIIRRIDGVEYKLMYSYADRTFEVYNLTNDLGETTDLADGSPAAADLETAARMTVLLREWLVDTGADLPTLVSSGAAVPLPAHTPAFVFDLGEAAGNAFDGLTTADVDVLGVTLSINAIGNGAVFAGNNRGVGVDSNEDAGTGAQQGRIAGDLATPESISFSFDEGVVLKGINVNGLSTDGSESLVLQFVSGDNPFVGLNGYTSVDGFSVAGDELSLAFTNTDGGDMRRTVNFGVLGQDEIQLSAGTVIALTTDPSVDGGLLLEGLVVALPLASFTISCDLDRDGDCDVDDVDALTRVGNLVAGVAATTVQSKYNLSADAVVDDLDLTVWLTSAAAFNGGSSAYVRGDTDLDGDLDTSDLTVAVINFTGAKEASKVWSDGDNDGDGDVDTVDLTTAISNFTGAIAANANVPDLIYDPATGNVTIDADGVDVISFSLQGGPFSAADFRELPAGLTDNIAMQIGWTSFNLFSGLTGLADLGAILPAGLNQTQVEAALTTASYGLALSGGGGGGRLDIIIPEPASMLLMGLGAMLLGQRCAP